MGGPVSRFRTTCWSAIGLAGSADPEERQHSYQVIVATYWKPVYKYIRIKWQKTNDDAKDLTQGFFSLALEKEWFQNYDPGKARFRTYLRTCLDGYLANEDRASRRLKRGGDQTIHSLDFEGAAGEISHDVPSPDAVDDYFDREWVRSLFAVAIEKLEADCQTRERQVHFSLFKSYDLDESEGPRPTYDDLALRHEIPATQVTNFLAVARRRFRQILLEQLRHVTGSEEEYRAEARSMLGIEV